MTRPTAGEVETRALPDDSLTVEEGRRLRGRIPYDVESRDFGGWREVIHAGALNHANLDDLVATINHEGVPIGRFPNTLDVEDRSDGLHWACEPPRSRADIVEGVERGDLRDTSWRMVVAKDHWEGEVRHIEEIRSLKDVSIVTTGAYREAQAELRHAPESPPEPPQPPEEAAVPPEETPQPGGLRLEDRSAPDPQETVESRYYDMMRSVPKGEARSLTLATAAPVEPPELSQYLFDALRPLSVFLAAGPRVITTDKQSWKAPQLTGDMSVDFYNELDPIDEDEPDFDDFEVVPAAIKGLVKGSSEAFEDSSPDLLTIVQGNLNTILALKLDAECLVGGSPKGFNGLLKTTGRQTIVGGDLSNYDWWVKAVGKLAEAHVPGPYAWIAHSRVVTALGLLKEWTTSESNEQLPRPVGMPDPFVTTQLPLDVTAPTKPKSSIIVFAPAQIILVRRRDITIEVDRSEEFSNDAVKVRGKLRAAIGTAHPEAICEVTNVTSPVIS